MKRANISKLNTEINTLTTRKQVLSTLEDAAILNDFMISVCEDPTKAEEYKLNPEEYLKKSGIPDHLIELVVSGSRYAFRAAAAGGKLVGSEGETVVVVVIIVIVVIL